MIKIYAINLSYDVSSEEKEQAEQSLLCFDDAIKKLNVAVDYLDIMATPFKDNPNIDSKEIVKYRAAMRRYRDELIKYFNNFKIAAKECMTSMQVFLSDTQILKLVKSFYSSIEEIEKKINHLSSLFNNIESKTLISDLNKDME